MPKGYVILTEAIKDRAGMDAYARAAMPAMAEGVSLLAADAQPQVLEGEWHGDQTVVLEFASVEAASPGLSGNRRPARRSITPVTGPTTWRRTPPSSNGTVTCPRRPGPAPTASRSSRSTAARRASASNWSAGKRSRAWRGSGPARERAEDRRPAVLGGRLAALGTGPPPIPCKKLSAPALTAAIRDAITRPSYRAQGAGALAGRLAGEDGTAPVVRAPSRLQR